MPNLIKVVKICYIFKDYPPENPSMFSIVYISVL